MNLLAHLYATNVTVLEHGTICESIKLRYGFDIMCLIKKFGKQNAIAS